jgi:tetratricopeptide (TPR) repeat protein
MAYGQFGRHEDALRLFHKLEQIAETYYISASVWALAYLGTGEYEQVMTLLERIDKDRRPEDTGIAFTFVNNRYHHPALERPEFVDIRNKLRLKR